MMSSDELVYTNRMVSSNVLMEPSLPPLGKYIVYRIIYDLRMIKSSQISYLPITIYGWHG